MKLTFFTVKIRFMRPNFQHQKQTNIQNKHLNKPAWVVYLISQTFLYSALNFTAEIDYFKPSM